MLTPPFAYFGGKQQIAGRIVSLLPRHSHYVEPFAGGLSVLLAKAPSKMETANDLDGDLMVFWRMLRDRPDELIRLCALTPHSRAELEACREPAEDELERARRTWVRISQGRTGTLLRVGWRHHINPSEARFAMPRYLASYVDRMAAVAERLARVSLECLPALTVIGKYGAHPANLLYVDPPYLGDTRAKKDRYQQEMKGEAEHGELAEALLSCRSAVVLSGYDSPLYRELYAGWDRVTIETASGNAAGDRSRTEVLWSNRPLGGSVQPDMFDEELSANAAALGGGAAV